MISIKLDEGLIIADSYIKKQILKEQSESSVFQDFTFLTFSELEQKLLGKVEEEGLVLLSKKFHLSPQTAKIYAKNLVYVKEEVYSDRKLRNLLEMKQYLISKNAIQKDSFFEDYIKKQKITFINPLKGNSYRRLTSSLDEKNVRESRVKYDQEKELSVYQLENGFLEMYFVFEKINELIEKGIPFSKIKLCNLKEEDSYLLSLFQESYHFSIQTLESKNCLSKEIYRSFLNLVKEGKDYETIFNELKRWNQVEDLNDLISMINRYPNLNPSELYPFFLMEIKEKKYSEIKYQDSIVCCDFDQVSDEDDFVFLMNFDMDFPRTKKDEDFLSDEQKNRLKIDTSIEENEFYKKNIIVRLNQFNNVTITYSLAHAFRSSLPSSLIKEFSMNIIQPNMNHLGSNKIIDSVYLSMKADLKDKYNMPSELLDNYFGNYLNYLSYSNEFSGIDLDLYQSLEPTKTLLSYSKLKEFFTCKFAFYANRILKVGDFEETLDLKLGNYAHRLLELSLTKNDFDFEAESDCYLNALEKETPLSEKEKYFFSRMKTTIKDIIEFNQQKASDSKFNKFLCEKEDTISLIDGKLIFTGKIDKLMIENKDQESYVAIVDYKTGSDKASLDNIEDGFNLQLPVYLYLLKKDSSIHNSKVIGFYLQHIKIETFSSSKDIKIQKEKAFALEGYTNENEALVIKLNPNYSDKNDTYLANFQKTSKGISARSKVFNDQDISNIIHIVESKIKEAYEGILKADYKINPKVIKEKDQSCNYCKFRDLCFRQNKDVVYLDYKPFKQNAKE